MEKLRYADLLDRLEGFDPWLTSLGLTARPNDRIHEAFKVLRRAEEASRKVTKQESTSIFARGTGFRW